MEQTQTNFEELFAFTTELSDTVFMLASESDGFMEMYSTDDRVIPNSYITKFMTDEVYSTIMKGKLRNLLLEEFTLNQKELEGHRNAEGELEYKYLDFDYSWVFAEFIRKQFDLEPRANYLEVMNKIIIADVEFRGLNYEAQWDSERKYIMLLTPEHSTEDDIDKELYADISTYVHAEMKLLSY